MYIISMTLRDQANPRYKLKIWSKSKIEKALQNINVTLVILRWALSRIMTFNLYNKAWFENL